MSDIKHDTLIISQIIGISNKALWSLMDDPTPKRHLTSAQLTNLANVLQLPDLVFEISSLQGADRRKSITIQYALKQKYKTVKIPELASISAELATQLPVSTQSDVLVPDSKATPTRTEDKQTTKASGPKVRPSKRPEKSQTVTPKNIRLGIVGWFNGEYGVIRSRFGETFVHKNNNPLLNLIEGDVVQFQERLDPKKNRSNANKCSTIASLDDCEDRVESVATLSYFLFDQFDLAPTYLKRVPISPVTLEVLIRYRLSLAYPQSTKDHQPLQVTHIPDWNELLPVIGDIIVNAAQSFTVSIEPAVLVFKTLQQRMPTWFNEDEKRQYLLEQCFWRPVQYCSGRLISNLFLDYIVYTNQTVKVLWQQSTVPTWCLSELQTNLESWCASILLDDELLEVQARERVQSLAVWLKVDPIPFEQQFQYTNTYKLKKWLKQPGHFAFPVPHTDTELESLLQQVPVDRLSDALTYLAVSQVVAVYPLLTETPVQTRIVGWLFEKQVQSLGGITFDIETDLSETIKEVCFTRGTSYEVYRSISEKTLSICISAFQESINQAKLLVGHNVREFDMPILARNGLDFRKLPVWDTLEIEALLNPLSRSFALTTAHDARSDTQTTVALFHNQLQRILLNWNQYAGLVQPFITAETYQWLQHFVDTFQDGFAFSADDDRKVFFHEEPIGIPVNFAQFTPNQQPTLLVAPRLTWPDFIRMPAIEFVAFATDGSSTLEDSFSEQDPFITHFDVDKIRAVVQHQYLQKALLAYIAACQEKRIAPTVANLPLWTKLRLQNELVSLQVICQAPTRLPDRPEPGTFYIIDDLSALLLTAAQESFWTLHHTNESLSSITFKYHLEQIRLRDNGDIFNQGSLWTRMVGGNRFAPLPRKWVTDRLGGMILPTQLNNFWLEKQNNTEFAIWGNINRPPEYDSLAADQDTDDSPQSSTAGVCPLTLVYAKEQAGLFYRLNPETPYRDVYWTGQFYLLQQLDIQYPLVWLIQNEHELPQLQAMVESMGYWSPPIERSLVRRLEMLHQSRKRRRLLIATLSVLPTLTQINYWGPLTLIIDSLPLTEIAMMVNLENQLSPEVDSSVADEVKEENEDEEQPADEDDHKPTEVQPQKLQRVSSDDSLRIITPLIDYYRRLLYQNNSTNQLFLTDPRTADQVSLAKEWSAKKQTVLLWQTEADYQALFSQVTRYIPSPKPITLTLSDLPAIQQTIERVFLGQNEQGEWLTLRQNQQPYFDSIIQPTDDLIVSLPTGGGKSVLFQGPALYRGSLTNRITVVVTPLRALMEDQVTKLEELGFFGCVEFINQQSDNIQDIYRRIAGGELTLVYVTPERFRSRSFDRALKMRMQRDHGLEYCVFDEAHCISQWGSEFRPDYLWVAMLISRLKQANSNFPVLFFSATISDQIYNDLTEIFSDQAA